MSQTSRRAPTHECQRTRAWYTPHACVNDNTNVDARIRTRRMRALMARRRSESLHARTLFEDYFKTKNLKAPCDQESKDRDVSISRPYSHQIPTATSPAQTRGGTSARERAHIPKRICVLVSGCVCVWGGGGGEVGGY
jgi:hypothetical protein